MNRICAVLILGVLAGTFAGGCTYTKVVPLDSRMTFNFKIDATGERKNYTAVIMPFTDGREQEYRSSKWHNIPGLGLFFQFIPTLHTHPDVTFNHYPSVMSDIGGGEAEYLMGNFSNSLPRKLAEGLKQAGIFKDIKVAEDLDENFDIRDYDYIIRGRVQQTDLRIKELTYGLSIFGLLDFSWVLKLLAAPDKYLAAEVAYDVEIVERQTKRSAWSGRVSYPKYGHLVGYYYGNRVEGLSPNVGLFVEVLKNEMSETVNKIKKEIKY